MKPNLILKGLMIAAITLSASPSLGHETCDLGTPEEIVFYSDSPDPEPTFFERVAGWWRFWFHEPIPKERTEVYLRKFAADPSFTGIELTGMEVTCGPDQLTLFKLTMLRQPNEEIVSHHKFVFSNTMETLRNKRHSFVNEWDVYGGIISKNTRRYVFSRNESTFGSCRDDYNSVYTVGICHFYSKFDNLKIETYIIGQRHADDIRKNKHTITEKFDFIIDSISIDLR
ncbi:hypothetical protein FHS85_000592 [Rhodoligotrophos appendicifer]|uniref:hypothetical protein n=1 Tax=Rhodoligotrophos appendicifer TaxID=987056 RepID=UPI00117CF6DF|nr:hypothetical protein [Rhodoligotrophos appendicifer]